jgi:hypothetical protein
MALRPICPARSLDAMKVADVSDRVRQAVLATAGEGMWNAGAFCAELDPFTLVLALETGATLRNPHANPVAAVVIAPHGPLAPFPAGLPRMHERMDTIVSDAGHAWRPRVEAALRAVPRHMFVPEADPGDTYRAHTRHGHQTLLRHPQLGVRNGDRGDHAGRATRGRTCLVNSPMEID